MRGIKTRSEPSTNSDNWQEYYKQDPDQLKPREMFSHRSLCWKGEYKWVK